MDDLAAREEVGRRRAARRARLRTLLDARARAWGRASSAAALRLRGPLIVARRPAEAALRAVAPARARACAPTPTRSTSAPGCSSPRWSARSSRSPVDGELRAGALGGHLVLGSPAIPRTPSSCRWPSRTTSRAVDRLRARALALPAAMSSTTPPTCAPPIGPAHPLRRRRARRGASAAAGRPGLDGRARGRGARRARGRTAGVARPHDDPDPARRVARRILQRLDGMGKWGGYHTEFAHLARGFAGNDRALAEAVGEALLLAGLLQREAERGPAPRVPRTRAAPRHPRADRATATVPPDLQLPRPSSQAAARAPSARVASMRQVSCPEALHACERSPTPASCARCGPDRLVAHRRRRCGAGGRRPPPATRVARHPPPRRARDRRRARDADLRGGPPPHQRAGQRARRRGHRRGRRRRDPVPQPPRLHRRDGRVLQARRARAVPQHDVRRAADHRRRRAREAGRAHLRRGVRDLVARGRRAAQALRRLARRRPGSRERPAARGPDRAGRHRRPRAAAPSKGRVVILTSGHDRHAEGRPAQAARVAATRPRRCSRRSRCARASPR